MKTISTGMAKDLIEKGKNSKDPKSYFRALIDLSKATGLGTENLIREIQEQGLANLLED
jgi:hypothetical protein